jgi:hypothetical protein
MRNFLITSVHLAAFLGAILVGSAARADILVSQPYDGFSPGAVSQVFPDFPTFSTKSFDDVVVSSPGWIVNSVTIFGQEQGDPTQNLSVKLQFASSANFNDSSTVYTGTEDTNGNLLFTGLNINLSPATYWLSAWVVRPELPTGGQWFWDQTTPVTGSEYIFHNPGGGLGFGTSPMPGSTISGSPADLAFVIQGQVVPEPGSLTLLGLGGLGLATVAWRRHQDRRRGSNRWTPRKPTSGTRGWRLRVPKLEHTDRFLGWAGPGRGLPVSASLA